MPYKDFMSLVAPENYVAGLGRGATGFTTRSDLGPAREGPSEEQMKELLARRAAQLNQEPPTAYGVTEKKEDDNEAEAAYQDPENDAGLFANLAYDREDDEADRIYQAVDEKMEKRRRARREAREKAEQEEYDRNNPKISEQFADLKRSLGTMTEDDWAGLPEVGDLTRKNKRARQEANAQKRFYAVPDSVIAGARDSAQLESTVQDDGMATNGDSADGTVTNFAAIGAARGKVLKGHLDSAAQVDSGTGTATNIDPKGYLTSLTKNELKAGEVDVGDIKRVRVLLESVIKTNPRHAPGWIAAARLEEFAGKQVAARNVMARGCEMCPKSEDAWLENIRLNENHNAKIIAASAIKNNDRSVRLWIEAMKLESDPRSKKRVLRKAIDHIPNSVQIWKEAVNLEEDPADARLLLAKATEVIPLSVELWLALARLESPGNARKVLNKARQAIPTSHEIWIAAARLEEQIGNHGKINILKRAVAALAKESAMLKREEWIQEAEKCEEEGAVLTCGDVIRETLGYGLDEDDDRKDVWMNDASESMGRDRFETARAIYAYALRVFPTSKSLWQAAAELEKNHGTKEALWQILEKATEAVPLAEDLWLQLAKEKWQAGSLDDARLVLAHAFKRNPNNQQIWLAAVKLEADNGFVSQARELLTQAREEAGTARVWYKSVAFERCQGSAEAAFSLVDKGLELFPSEAKLWMQKGQLYESQSQLPQARQAYSTGTRACPKSVALWLLASRLEEKAAVLIKARSILDRARLAVPKNAALWTESVRIERRAGNVAQAKVLMAKALQECPASGLLWSELIWHLEPRTQRKPRALEAVKKVDRDPILFVAVARIFWAERRLDKAASWFEKAIVLDPDYGDTWAWYWKFLIQHGTEVSERSEGSKCSRLAPSSTALLQTHPANPSLQEKRTDTLQKCTDNEPRHGELWQAVAKDAALIAAGTIKGTKDVLVEVVRGLEGIET
jgi:pre-mRNA-processing factor 6